MNRDAADVECARTYAAIDLNCLPTQQIAQRMSRPYKLGLKRIGPRGDITTAPTVRDPRFLTLNIFIVELRVVDFILASSCTYYGGNIMDCYFFPQSLKEKYYTDSICTFFFKY